MDLIWVMFAFFILITIVFIIVGFFFPELLGITGNKAKEIQRHHEEDKDKN